MQEPFIYEVAGALIPVALIAALIAILYLWDAMLAEYKSRRPFTLDEAIEFALTCDRCGRRHSALFPMAHPLDEQWLCLDCHPFAREAYDVPTEWELYQQVTEEEHRDESR